MAGHSHFANIMYKKARADAQRGRAFSKISRLLMAAVKAGGPKAEDNPRLALALEKARAANMSKDTVQRAIDRASGAGGSSAFEELLYEGYGPGGVAVLVEALTDNRNRTNSEVRSAFDKNGGSLGATGSVLWMFQRRGEFQVPAAEVGEEEIYAAALEAGAEDVTLLDPGGADARWLISTEPREFALVRHALVAAGLDASRAEITYVPTTVAEANEEVARAVMRIQSALESLDDVQSVTTNLDVSAEVAARLGDD